MDFSNSNWISVKPKEFNKLLASSNPLREAWSNGELLYEFRGTERHILGFVDLNGFVRVPPEIHQKFFA
jgi:hypothetical protein